MKNKIILLLVVAFVGSLTALITLICKYRPQPNAIQVQRIWEGDYCAFTSLVKYNDKYYCAFREAPQHHVTEDGKGGIARIIVSGDGKQWESLAAFEMDGVDLRDPKLSQMPDGRLMILMDGSVYDNRKLVNMYPQVSFSEDGITFSDLQPAILDSAICHDYEWIWRVTWHEGVGYGVIYGSQYTLVKTTDGIHYQLVTALNIDNAPGETTLRFLSDGTMLLMARCEGQNKHGVWGKSLPPYTDWEYTEMNIPLGGPDFLVVDDSLTILGTRSLYASEKTMMLKGTLDGNFEEICILPSGGDDNSYPGMLIEGNELWVTYYSRHELDKAAIYLAKLPLSDFLSPRTNTYFFK
ncbi:MAG: glycoside hydrolase [Paludibacteraceae bacterium]|nr:glycoside hydrolase [Paludibacteraceae bacterium]